MTNKPYTRDIIHEGEYVGHNPRSLPINTLNSVSNFSFDTPVRLNSPHLKQGDVALIVDRNVESSPIPSALFIPFSNPSDSPYGNQTHSPKILHKWSHTHLILCVVPAPQKKLLLCGTQDSKILVFDMVDYSLKYEIKTAQEEDESSSILCLEITNDESFLFSAGSDSIVKVWDLSDIASSKAELTHIIYSVIDIGDIFSLSWSKELSTLFIGAQNASILWTTLIFQLQPLEYADNDSTSTLDRLPYLRYNKFFDSKGPGGLLNTLQLKQIKAKQSKTRTRVECPKLIEIKNDDIIRFAHNGYVYCMDLLKSSHNYYFNKHSEEEDIGNNSGSSAEPASSSHILISCGGDGIINIWDAKFIGERLNISKLKSLENNESILSMSIQDCLYVGLSDSTINVWDLSTFQLVRSFQFTPKDKSHDEVLSIGIYNDCIFKASNLGGLVKFTLRRESDQPPSSSNLVSPDSNNASFRGQDVIISEEDQTYNNLFQIEIQSGAVLSVNIFESDGTTYLVSGGHKALCLWDISSIGPKKQREPSVLKTPSVNGFASYEYSNENMLSRLQTYISFKTISKFPTLYLEDSRHCAQFLSKLLIDMGAQETNLLPVPNGNPIVYSLFKRNSSGSKGKPTRVLWYAHYDVVDATNNEADDWKTDPFTLSAKDGNLYARGVSDNKGPTLAAIYAVAELYQKKELSCDVVFIVEGEEECGSIGFQDAINDNKDVIGNIDWVMLSNSYWLDDETPCLNYGLRGVINASVTIKSQKPDRHSGVDGGVLKEPTMNLIQILSGLVDRKTNKIQLDGFYDGVLSLNKTEIELYQKIQEYALTKKINDQDLQTLTAKWRDPSLTVHKIQVSGPNNNTVIPQVAKATISIRIVPNQNLEAVKESLINFLNREFADLRSDNKLLINIFHEAEPWLGDPTNLVYKILFDKIRSNWQNVEPLFVREGGSIPSIRFLEKAFGAPAAQIPCGQALDNAHLKDEKLRIINLYKLRSILSDTLKELGDK